MENSQKEIDAFFENYEARFNKILAGQQVQPESTAMDFAEFFVGASPQGVQGGANDREFLISISRGNTFYRNIGTQSMKIKHKTLIPIDALHVLVKVHWSSDYLKKTEKINIEFDVTYCLQLRDEGPKIFAYVTGDEQKVLREHGLIPAEGKQAQ